MEDADKLEQKTTTAIYAKKRRMLSNIISDEINEATGCDDAASREHSRRAEIFSQLNNFGLWMLNIQEAAELIACDMWVEGEIEVEELDDFDGQSLAPEVKAALSEVISAFVTRLTRAIEMGRLQPASLARDFDENLILTETFLELPSLEKWLRERGYYFGDAFRDWHHDEAEIGDRIIDELIWLRSVKGSARDRMLSIGFTGNTSLIDESSQTDLIAAYKSAVLENQHLRERLANAESRSMEKPEPPASPKHRRTLLTLIGALCEAAGLDVKKRGVAQRLMKMTEQVGAPVDDETIRKIIADIPEALESRSR